MRIPGAKRTVQAPDGRRWRVGRRWTPTTRVRLRRQRDGLDLDTASGFGDGDLDAFAIALVVAVVAGLVLLLIFPLLELLIVLALLVVSVASRVLLRRPWRVEARALDGPVRDLGHWDVVGFRRSGAVTREVAEHLATTGELPRAVGRSASPSARS